MGWVHARSTRSHAEIFLSYVLVLFYWKEEETVVRKLMMCFDTFNRINSNNYLLL